MGCLQASCYITEQRVHRAQRKTCFQDPKVVISWTPSDPHVSQKFSLQLNAASYDEFWSGQERPYIPFVVCISCPTLDHFMIHSAPLGDRGAWTVCSYCPLPLGKVPIPLGKGYSYIINTNGRPPIRRLQTRGATNRFEIIFYNKETQTNNPIHKGIRTYSSR